jgi:hypothetical protein
MLLAFHNTYRTASMSSSTQRHLGDPTEVHGCNAGIESPLAQYSNLAVLLLHSFLRLGVKLPLPMICVVLSWVRVLLLWIFVDAAKLCDPE